MPTPFKERKPKLSYTILQEFKDQTHPFYMVVGKLTDRTTSERCATNINKDLGVSVQVWRNWGTRKAVNTLCIIGKGGK